MLIYRKPLLGLHVALLVLLLVALLGSRGQMSETEKTLVRVTEMETGSVDGAPAELPPDSLSLPLTEREKEAATYFGQFRETIDKKHKALFRRLGEAYSFFSMHNIILIIAMGITFLSLVLVWKQDPASATSPGEGT